MTQQNIGHPGKEGKRAAMQNGASIPSFCFPPFKSIWVRKGKWDTESEQESNNWKSMELVLFAALPQEFWSLTRKKTYQSFPADSGVLCSPPQGAGLLSPSPCESAKPTKHRPFTDSTRPQRKDRNGFDKMFSNTANHLFFCLLMTRAEPQSLKWVWEGGNWTSQIKREIPKQYWYFKS